MTLVVVSSLNSIILFYFFIDFSVLEEYNYAKYSLEGNKYELGSLMCK